MFKKKIKRSAWFKGLLEAEELYKEGYQYYTDAGGRIWFSVRGIIPQDFQGIPIKNKERYSGVKDYVEHREKNPEIFQKDSQNY